MTSAPPAPPPPPPPGARPAAPKQPAGFTPIVHSGPSTSNETAMLIYSPPGVGKTTILSQACDLIIMVGQETGYDALLRYDRVPMRDRIHATKWGELRGTLRWLKDQEPCWIGIDQFGSADALCAEHVCRTHFKGDWGRKGFQNYGAGSARVQAEWQETIAEMESLRANGFSFFIAAHAGINVFRNPMGGDFAAYHIECHQKKSAPLLTKWLDTVLFYNFESIEHEDKGIGGEDRVVYTENRDAFEAKNRCGAPAEIRIPNDHTKAWASLAEALKINRS